MLAVLLAALGSTPAQAREAEAPGWPVQAYDAVVLRPLGLIQTAAGATAFLLAYPISRLTGGSDHVVDACITGPVDQTFRKPLGEL
ncbi:MAG: hypothetical protein JSU66_12920 [Deltaproteobacteria bacterium]|nr:MAG: hypothetical protein JSU66_12920 [Deltaproteobacteria bacterium]